MLKSGCSVERVYFDTCERVLRSIAINLIVAWRLLFIGLLGGKLPDLPADIMFDDNQLNVIYGYAIKHGYPPPNSLNDVLFIIGLMGGGYVNKSYPKPGYMSIKDGISKLRNFKNMMELFKIGMQDRISA